MKHVQIGLIAAVLLVSSHAYAQNSQWQVQIGTQNAPTETRHGGHAVQPLTPVPPAPPAQGAQTVESIQAQQDLRIRWAAQRGYITEPEYRRLAQMQANIEHNRRIAYADGFFNPQEQQYVFGQLNLLSAEIDTLMLNGHFALPYYQQFTAPIPVWALNAGWLNGRYDVRADNHHNRAYRPAAQPPAIVQPTQPVPQDHPRHRNRLRDVLDPLGIFR